MIVGLGTISKVVPPAPTAEMARPVPLVATAEITLPVPPTELAVAATLAAIITAVPAPDAGAEIRAVARKPVFGPAVFAVSPDSAFFSVNLFRSKISFCSF